MIEKLIDRLIKWWVLRKWKVGKPPLGDIDGDPKAFNYFVIGSADDDSLLLDDDDPRGHSFYDPFTGEFDHDFDGGDKL